MMKPNRNDMGLWYVNDPTRVDETAEYMANQFRTLLLDRKSPDFPSPLYDLLVEKSPHYNSGLDNGETMLALWRALALLQIDICNNFTRLGYESKHDFYDSEDEDEDAAA